MVELTKSHKEMFWTHVNLWQEETILLMTVELCRGFTDHTKATRWK